MLELSPMKRGLSVAGRFLLWFLCAEIVETLILAAGPLTDSASGSAPFRLIFWAGYALESLPASAAIALLGAGFLATRTLRHRLSGYLILGTLTVSLLGGGTWLFRGLESPPEPFPNRSPASASPRDLAPYFVRSLSGDKAAGIVYARPAGSEPRLVWAASGTYARDKGFLLVDRISLPLADARPRGSPDPLPGFRELRTWYLELGRGDRFQALAASIGTALLIVGLWPLSRLFRWPLIGAFAVITAFVLLGSLHGVLRSPAAGDLAALIGLRVPGTLLVGILAGAIGLALILLDFALCPSFSSLRRNRGRPR